MNPLVPIDVDTDTGVWTSDGLPMLYVPRHFFVNNHVAIEQALGRDAYSRLLYDAGHKSAHTWCNQVFKQRPGDELGVVKHYLTRLSQRGWGQFELVNVNATEASAQVQLRNSSMVLGRPAERGKLCYMFAGWFAGAMDWLCTAQGIPVRARCQETECQGEGHSHCTFTVDRLTTP